MYCVLIVQKTMIKYLEIKIWRDAFLIIIYMDNFKELFSISGSVLFTKPSSVSTTPTTIL